STTPLALPTLNTIQPGSIISFGYPPRLKPQARKESKPRPSRASRCFTPQRLFSSLLGGYSTDARAKRCHYSQLLLKPTGQPVPAYGSLSFLAVSAMLTFK